MDRYNFGVATGHNDVTNNPNNYGLYNKTQYDQNYNEGYNAGKADSPISSGSLVATFVGNHYHNWNDGALSQSGSTGFDCSRIWVSCAGFANHNAVLLVYNASGGQLTSISLNNNGNYEWSGSGIRSWNISYNFPSGHSTINYRYNIQMYY